MITGVLTMQPKYSNITYIDAQLRLHVKCPSTILTRQFCALNTSCTSLSAVVPQPCYTESGASSSKTEQPTAPHIYSDGIMAEGYMECSTEKNDDDDDEQSDMDTKEQGEEEGQDVEMQHPPIPPPFMPPPRRRMRHMRARE